MVSDRITYDRITKWIRWLARGIGTIMAVTYLYLGITTGPTLPSIEEIIVVLTLVLGVLIVWRREGLGGLILVLAAMVLFLIMVLVIAAEYIFNVHGTIKTNRGISLLKLIKLFLDRFNKLVA